MRGDARAWDKLTRDQRDDVVSWLRDRALELRHDRGAMEDLHGFDFVGALEALAGKLGGTPNPTP